MSYWNNDDDCRAGGDALVFAIQPGGSASIVNSTITGEGGCLMIAECALDQNCTGTEKITVKNTLFLGQRVFYTPEEDTCFAWYDDESSQPLPGNPFIIEYDIISGARFGNVDPCASTTVHCDINAGVTNPTIDSFDAHLTINNPAIDGGSPINAPIDDFTGQLRDDQPYIGAYE